MYIALFSQDTVQGKNLDTSCKKQHLKM